jgi:hypothetical protein
VKSNVGNAELVSAEYQRYFGAFQRHPMKALIAPAFDRALKAARHIVAVAAS